MASLIGVLDLYDYYIRSLCFIFYNFFMHTIRSAYCILFPLKLIVAYVLLKEKPDMQRSKVNGAAKTSTSQRGSGKERKNALQQDVWMQCNFS